MNEKDDQQGEPLVDLEVDAEQATETKAGALGSGGGGGQGKVSVHDISITK